MRSESRTTMRPWRQSSRGVVKRRCYRLQSSRYLIKASLTRSITNTIIGSGALAVSRSTGYGLGLIYSFHMFVIVLFNCDTD